MLCHALAVAGGPSIPLARKFLMLHFDKKNTKQPLSTLNFIRRIYSKFCPAIYIPNYLLNFNGIHVIFCYYHLNLVYEKFLGKKVGDKLPKFNKLTWLGRKQNILQIKILSWYDHLSTAQDVSWDPRKIVSRLTRRVALDELFTHTITKRLHLQNGDNSNACFPGLPWRLNEVQSVLTSSLTGSWKLRF